MAGPAPAPRAARLGWQRGWGGSDFVSGWVIVISQWAGIASVYLVPLRATYL